MYPPAGVADNAAQDDGVRVFMGDAAIESEDRPRPLLVVDGVIIEDSAFDMESLDIESIEVIRGSVAAERFGPRAANGVILVRTRTASRP